jgi:DNA polymerase-1
MAVNLAPPPRTLWLIDGTHYVYRAFFAISGLSSPSGFPTNAIFGFLRMIQHLMEKFAMQNALVTWDSPEPSWRHQKYASYKAHREEMPNELYEQIPVLMELIQDMGIPQIRHPGYEADDLIYTAVQELGERYVQLVIVSNDKDLYQLIQPPEIVGFHPQLKEFVDTEFVRAKYGVLPSQMRDYLALLGDATDGIPGVPGVGPKTAAYLLTHLGSLKTVMDELANHPDSPHLSKLSKKSREHLLGHEDRVWASHTLIGLTLAPEVRDFLTATDYCLLRHWDNRVLQKFEALGFKGMQQDFKKRVPSEGLQSETSEGKAEPVSEAALSQALTSRNQPDLDERWVYIFPQEHSWWLQTTEFDQPLAPPSGQQTAQPLQDFRDSDLEKLSSRCRLFWVYDLKSLLHVREGFKPGTAQVWDVMLIHYLHHPSAFEYRAPEPEQLLSQWRSVLSPVAHSRIYQEVEFPLISVLVSMERRGILLNREKLRALHQAWQEKLERISHKVIEQAGIAFNIQSPKQLAEVLYERCRLPVLKRKKTGPSTDADTLTQLKGMHPIVDHLLAHRELAKLIHTYTEPLLWQTDEDAVLHTEFLQYGTASGRLASRNPNLQNIPQASEYAESLRACFEPREGFEFLGVDYNQIELRLLAHLSDSSGLISTFQSDEDVHQTTALELFGNRAKESAKWRSLAKTINFGILYGQTAFGLSRVAGISQTEAQEFIDKYYQKYPEVKAFQAKVIQTLHQEGEVRTLMGRVRRFSPKELESGSRRYGHVLRAAFNSVLQGSAADIIKLAMIQVHKALQPAPPRFSDPPVGYLVLQVHDELLFEIRRERLAEWTPKLVAVMEGIGEEMVERLKVPLRVRLQVGKF